MDSKKPSFFGKFFKGKRSGDKVTPEDIKAQKALVRKDPNNLRALHKLGDLYAKAEQIDHAVATYTQAAESYIERAFYQKAVAVLKHVLKLKPNKHDVQQRLAEVYIELGRRSDALATYQALARKYESTGSLDQAADMLLHMLQLDEENVPLRVKLAEIYLAKQDLNLAIDEFEKALNSLAQVEKWEDYIKVGERLLYVAPEHLNALKSIARVYLDHDDVMKAMAKLQQAFKLEPRDPETLEVLAVGFDRVGQPEKTISVLKELSDIYSDMGRLDYVRDVYQQILERDPNDAETLAAIDALPTSTSVSELPSAAPIIKEAPIPTPPQQTPPTPPPVEPSLHLTDEEVARLLNEADVYIKYGLVPRVEEALNRIFAASPQHNEARKLKVELLKMQERTEEAAQELMSLAQESNDDDTTLALLEQILELEDVSPALQEEAYQQSIRIRPRPSSSHIPAIQSIPLGAPIHPPEDIHVESGVFEITSGDDFDVISGDDFDVIDVDAISTSQDELDIVSIEDLDAVEIGAAGSGEFIQPESTSEFSLQQLDDDATIPPSASFEEYGSLEELDSVEFIDDGPSEAILDQHVPDVQELELLDEEDNPTIPPMSRTQFEEAADDPFGGPTEFATPEPTPTPTDTPAFAPAPSFAPPVPTFQTPPPPSKSTEDDPFAKFISRATVDEPVEEESYNYDDFLSTPVEVAPPAGANAPTKSSGVGELSEMEAAAARLQALIQAKEEAESKEEDDAIDALSTPTTNTAPIPAPFATPVPPPFSPPPPTQSPDLLPIEEPITQHLTADDLSEVEEDLNTQSIPLDANDALIEDNTNTPLFIEEQDATATEEYSTEEIAEEIAHITEEAPLFEEETFDGAFGEDDFGDFDNAFEEVQEEEIVSFDVDSDDPFIEELEEAAFYLDQEEPQYAIEIFDRILQKAPEHVAAQAGLQMALQAEQELQTAAQEDDGFLVNLDAALGAVASTKRERDRVEGELKAFQQEAQKQFGEDGEALYELGVAYYGMALYDMAVGAFQNCLRNQYREFDCYKMIGTCYGSQGQNDQAIKAYQQALQLPTLTTDEKIDVLFELGQALENSGSSDDALAYYQQVYMLDEHYRGVQERIQHLRAG